MEIIWKDLITRLQRVLRVKTTPIGMKLFETEDEMKVVPKIRCPKDGERFLVCQMVGQAARLNFTVGFTRENILAPQCRSVLGFDPRGDEFLSGRQFHGVWYERLHESAAHQAAMYTVEYGRYTACAISPLESGRLDTPDICMLYMTPGQMIHFINGLQWRDYRVIHSSIVGESTCSDTWGKAIATGEPSVSIPCFAERRYGCTLDEEMLICLKPVDFLRAIEGMEALSRNGLRYPAPFYGVQRDATEGMSVTYEGLK